MVSLETDKQESALLTYVGTWLIVSGASKSTLERSKLTVHSKVQSTSLNSKIKAIFAMIKALIDGFQFFIS